MAKSKYQLKEKKSYIPHVFNFHDILGIAAIIWALSFILSFGVDFDLDKGIKLGFESEDLEDISSLLGSIDTVDYFGDIGGIL